MDIHQYVQPVLDYFSHHKTIGLVATFFIAFLEALPIIGTIVPGSVTMTLIGVLVGTQVLPGYLTFALACCGAYCGDWIGFVFGFYFQDRVAQIWPFNKNPKWLKAGRVFFDKHGVTSVIVGRFFGPIRSTVPMIAGILNMPWIQFFFAAMPAALIWALLYMGPGIILGHVALELSPATTTKILVYGVLSIVFIWFIFWVIERFFAQISRTVHRIFDALWQALGKGKHARHFIYLIENQQDKNDARPLSYLFISLLLFLTFSGLFGFIYHGGTHNSFNFAVNYLMQGVRQPGLQTFFILLTNVGKTPITFIMATLLACLLLIKKEWEMAICIVAAAVSTAGLTGVFKHLTHSARPQWIHYIKSTSSFPSGHTAMATVWYCTIAYFSALVFKRRRFITYLSILLILLTAVSRLYLGAHWPTDVIGSLLLSTAVFTLTVIAFKRIANRPVRLSKGYWLASMLMSTLLPWSIYSALSLKQEQLNSRIVIRTQQFTYQNWFNHPLRYLPAYRKNRLGKMIEPLNVQWMQPIQQIEQQLTKAGFKKESSVHDLKSGLANLARTPQNRLPMIAKLYQNTPPVLLMVKKTNTPDTVIEIRLWNSHSRIILNSIPLWIGSINYRSTVQGKNLIQRNKKITHYQQNNQNVLTTLSALFSKQDYRILIQQQTAHHLKKIQEKQWDNKVIIITPSVNPKETPTK